MPRSLPPRPSLEYLRKEAKDLLAAHQSGDASACDVLRLHHRFEGASDADILAVDLSLQEVQHALAVTYGFKGWTELRAAVSAPQRPEGASTMATITLDGKSYRGSRISVTIDGKPVELDLQTQEDGRVQIEVKDVLGDLASDLSLVIKGEISGDVTAEGSVRCQGVEGNVAAGDSVKCGGVGGDVECGGDVSCGGVGGDVECGGDVHCGGVAGDVQSEGDVVCGDIAGDVEAGGNVKCAEVSGDIHTDAEA